MGQGDEQEGIANSPALSGSSDPFTFTSLSYSIYSCLIFSYIYVYPRGYFCIHASILYTLFAADENEQVAILFLNPDESMDYVSTEDSGVKIYGENVLSHSFSIGYSAYPSTHPDFLSRANNLTFSPQSWPNVGQIEFIPFLPNRLTLIKPLRPFQIAYRASASHLSSETFPYSQLVAFVVFLH